MSTAADIARFSFAVTSSADTQAFEPFILDVPAIDGDEDRAARRAWWSAFHMLGPRGIEPEAFDVHCWIGEQALELVTAGGILR